MSPLLHLVMLFFLYYFYFTNNIISNCEDRKLAHENVNYYFSLKRSNCFRQQFDFKLADF